MRGVTTIGPSTPAFTIGDRYAMYRGPVADSTFHRHAAFQIVIAVRGEAEMVDRAGGRHRAPALLVAPMCRHRLLAAPKLVIYFVEPHCGFADRLRSRAGIAPAPDLAGVHADEIAVHRPSAELDPRLLQALDLLRDNSFAIPELAATVGLSAQRLRALARTQLDMPLARWRIWARLRRAAAAMQAGRSVADAAAAGGFADQAHFTRQLREMLGLTPAAVQRLLCAESRRAT